MLFLNSLINSSSNFILGIDLIRELEQQNISPSPAEDTTGSGNRSAGRKFGGSRMVFGCVLSPSFSRRYSGRLLR